ncbi:HAD family hydrolase [Pedobacter sp. KBW06]|uniref:HAD family hydrolase n=1 Tax=Pedobacter sp. KBW06 TaxID=2153359 RepID=UPI0013157398|nr:HAD family hydrolase [Pedobacter sp. KBW06]
MEKIPWKTLELVIFDVDGTLYDQLKLRTKMLLALIGYYTLRPWKYKDLLILYHFRKEREKNAGSELKNLQEAQYQWCLKKVNTSLTEVKSVVDKWIFDFPNRYLQKCSYPGIHSFFEELEKQGISTAVYSDYEAKNKLEKMNIRVNLVVSSTHTDINALKPLPNGLTYILSEMKIENKANCLFIGDREELDGECSRAAGIPFLFLDKKTSRYFYPRLLEKLKNSGI